MVRFIVFILKLKAGTDFRTFYIIVATITHSLSNNNTDLSAVRVILYLGDRLRTLSIVRN